jgi:hypothetical protein
MLRLKKKISQNGNLDGAGLRHDLVAMQKIFFAGSEVFDSHGHDAVEAGIHLADTVLQLLPENFLLL